MKSSVLIIITIGLLSANLFAERFDSVEFENAELENNIEMAMSAPVPGGGKVLVQVGEELFALFMKVVKKRGLYEKLPNNELDDFCIVVERRFDNIYLKEAEYLFDHTGLDQYDIIREIKTKIYVDELVQKNNLPEKAVNILKPKVYRIIATTEDFLHFKGYIKGFDDVVLTDDLLMENIITKLKTYPEKYYSYDIVLKEKVLDLEKAYNEVLSDVKTIFDFPKRKHVVDTELINKIVKFVSYEEERKLAEDILIEQIDSKSLSKYLDKTKTTYNEHLIQNKDLFLITETNSKGENVFHAVSIDDASMEKILTFHPGSGADLGYFEPIIFRSVADNRQIWVYKVVAEQENMLPGSFTQEELLEFFDIAMRTNTDEFDVIGFNLGEAEQQSVGYFSDLFVELSGHNYVEEYGYQTYAVNIYFNREYVKTHAIDIIDKGEISQELVEKVEFLFERPENWLENFIEINR